MLPIAVMGCERYAQRNMCKRFNCPLKAYATTQSRSVYFDFYFVAVGITDESGKPFTRCSIVDLSLGWLQSFALKSGDYIVDARSGSAQAEMLFAQVSGGVGIG